MDPPKWQGTLIRQNEGSCKVLNDEYMFDTYIVEWYYINRGATDRRLSLKFVDYKSNR